MKTKLLTLLAAASLLAGCASTKSERQYRSDAYSDQGASQQQYDDATGSDMERSGTQHGQGAGDMGNRDTYGGSAQGSRTGTMNDEGFVNPYANSPSTLPPSEDSEAYGTGINSDQQFGTGITGTARPIQSDDATIGPVDTDDATTGGQNTGEDSQDHTTPGGSTFNTSPSVEEDEDTTTGDQNTGNDPNLAPTPTPDDDEDANTGDQNTGDLETNDDMPGSSPNTNNTSPGTDDDNLYNDDGTVNPMPGNPGANPGTGGGTP